MPIIGASIGDAWNQYKQISGTEQIKTKLQNWETQGKEVFIFKKEPAGLDWLKAKFGQTIKEQWIVGTFIKDSKKDHKIEACKELIEGIPDNADVGLLKIRDRANAILNELQPKEQELR